MSKIKVWAGLVSPEAPPLGLKTAAFTLHAHVAFPPCLGIPGVCLSLVNTSVLLDEGLTFTASLNLNYLLKIPVS